MMDGRAVCISKRKARRSSGTSYPARRTPTRSLRSRRPAIVKGFDTGTFGPSEPMSRGQMAAFLARAFDLEAILDEQLGATRASG